MEADFLFVERLKVSVRIGTTSEERAFPQVVLISVEIQIPLENAGKSDRLENTLDYASVVSDIEALAKTKEFVLVEALAEGISEVVLKRPGVKATRVRVEKRVLPQVESVGVQIWRSHKP